VFTGWNTQADGSGTPYNAGATFTITSNVTLHAIWKTAYEIWLAANGATASDANFLSFAFGSDAPGLTGSASYDAGPPAVVTPGQPTTTLTTGDPIDFRAVFSRRSDYATAGLAYTLQFSADLNFGDGFREDVSVAAPNGTTIKLLGTETVDGVSVDIMSVSYPWLIPVGAEFKKPTFFRVKVNSTSSSGQTPP
jgi:Listeria-Bacteroides repeat domain (List_Bact_rpt)